MFLKKNIVGIDVSDSSIKLLQLNEAKEVIACNTVSLPHGVVVGGQIVDEIQFEKSCIKILAHTKSSEQNSSFVAPEAIVSLPEGKVWSHTIVIPDSVPEIDYETYVKSEAEKIIPLGLTEFYTTSSVTKLHGVWFATFVAAEKDIVNKYRDSLSKAGIRVAFIGSNFYSIARAVLPKAFGNENYLIIDVGEQQTTIGAFDENGVVYLTVQSALVNSETKKEALGILTEDVLTVTKRFKKYLDQDITKVIVSGNVDNQRDIVAAIAEVINVEISAANPLRHISNTQIISENIAIDTLGNVVGLALYGVDRTLPHINLLPEQNKVSQRLQNDLLTKILHSFNSLKVHIQDRFQKRQSLSKIVGILIFFVVALTLLVYVVVHYI